MTAALKTLATWIVRLLVLLFIAFSAYDVRMHAIKVYGLVIHEFDPWFNFRATQYLADHGWTEFFHWYDYMSWSPLGRPVGTTIYPGMQIVSVFIWRVLNSSGIEMSLNDVCCYVPVWFGVFATMLLGSLTYVASGSADSSIAAAAVMSIIPAHIMRSVGGGFDNESVAISALCLTFLLWMYSLSGKDDSKMSFIGIFTGLAYVCMVAAWGGYIFVLNMIGLHAFVLIAMGRFSNKLYWAYSFWYVVGTFGAIHVPVVGFAPLKSLEQLAPAGVFFLMQLLQICENPRLLKLYKLDADTMTPSQRFRVRTHVFGAAAAGASIVIAYLYPTGYFGPLSSRVRGLFVTHTRTGNPLVDSVAEHQPASPQAYWQFLQYACHTSPIGFAIALYSSVIRPIFHPRQAGEPSTDPMVFLVLYAMVSYHFSTKMNRLMLLMGPICSALTGIAIGAMSQFVYDEVYPLLFPTAVEGAVATPVENIKAAGASGKGASKKKAEKPSSKKTTAAKSDSVTDLIESKVQEIGSLPVVNYLRKFLVAIILYSAYVEIPSFYLYSNQMGEHLSNPSLMFQARLHDGTVIMVDDYREAYWWLRDKTPEDARVMAWWDYGYQITGIGNRTTIADGNTWNHEAITITITIMHMLFLSPYCL
jgi:dolichyl-diphosphooligosaccharide---protein glycosyltransferase